MNSKDPGVERNRLPCKLHRLLAVAGIVIALATWAMLLPQPIAELMIRPGFRGWYNGRAGYLLIWQIGICLLLASPIPLLIGVWALFRARSWAKLPLLAYAWMWLAGASLIIILNSLFTMDARSTYVGGHYSQSQQFRFIAGRIANGVQESVFPLLIILICRWPELGRFSKLGRGETTLVDPPDDRGIPLSVRLVRTLCIVGMVFGGVALAILFTSSGSLRLDVLLRFPRSRAPWLDSSAIIFRLVSSVLLFCGSAATLVRKHWGPMLLLAYAPIWILTAMCIVVRGQFLPTYFTYPPRWVFALSDSARGLIVCAHAVFVFVCLRWPEVKLRAEEAGGFQPIFGTLAVIPVAAEADAVRSAQEDVQNPRHP